MYQFKLCRKIKLLVILHIKKNQLYHTQLEGYATNTPLARSIGDILYYILRNLKKISNLI